MTFFLIGAKSSYGLRFFSPREWLNICGSSDLTLWAPSGRHLDSTQQSRITYTSSSLKSLRKSATRNSLSWDVLDNIKALGICKPYRSKHGGRKKHRSLPEASSPQPMAHREVTPCPECIPTDSNDAPPSAKPRVCVPTTLLSNIRSILPKIDELRAIAANNNPYLVFLLWHVADHRHGLPYLCSLLV